MIAEVASLQIGVVVGDNIVYPKEAFGLSTREDQVLTLMWAGNTDSEIAFQLGLATATVRQYKQRLQAKIGADRPGSIMCCMMNKLWDRHLALSSSDNAST